MTEGAPGPTVARPAAFYGAIQGAVASRASTAEIWDAIRSYASANNVSLPPGMFSAVNTMRALASGNRNASEQVMRAGRDEYITNKMVGNHIYSRAPDDRARLGLYHVTFSVQSTRGGVTNTEYFRLQYSDANLPDTVGELRDDIMAYSAGLGEVYGTDVVDYSDVFIGAY